MGWTESRKNIGEPFVQGIGVEIGAGLNPVHHGGVEKLYFFDKRNPEEFEQYFGSPPEYDLINLEGLRAQHPGGIDFITCHHVVEHLDNPIEVLKEWISMLRFGGVFYLSIPSQDNSIERGRLPTPASHILEDYFFQRPASSYESKQHISSFVHACTASGGPVRPWFADNTTEDYAKFILYDIGRRGDHDLHWHTYDLATIRSVIEAAFHVSGCSADILACEETEDSHYLAVRKVAQRVPPPALVEFHEQITQTLARCSAVLMRTPASRGVVGRPDI